MKIRFDDARLERMGLNESYNGGFGRPVERGFRKVLRFILSAKDETALYRMKSLHFEKLSGKRKQQRSMRINEQFRLIIEIETRKDGNILILKGIEDYH